MDAVVVLLGMGFLHELKTIRLMLQMNAVHTIHTPRSGNAGGFQSQGAVPLFDLPYTPIDGGIGDAGHSQVAQNIFLPPEGKGLAEGAPAFIAVAAKFKVRLLPQLALTGQHSRNGMPPGLPLKLVQRGLFHVVTAPGRDRKGGVQKIFILLTVVNRLLSILVQQFTVQAGQTVRLALPCAANGIGHFLGNDRIAVFFNNLRKRIAWAKPNHIVFRFYKIAQFRVFQPCVNIHGGNIGADLPCQIKEYRGILTARKAGKDLPVVRPVPFQYFHLRYFDLFFEAPTLHDVQILPGVLHSYTTPTLSKIGIAASKPASSKCT